MSEPRSSEHLRCRSAKIITIHQSRRLASEHLSGVRNSRTVQTALEAAGVEFTNGGEAEEGRGRKEVTVPAAVDFCAELPRPIYR